MHHGNLHHASPVWQPVFAWVCPMCSSTLYTLNDLVLYVFTIEAALKILAEGKRPWRYGKDRYDR